MDKSIAAQDEHLRVVQSKSKKLMPIELRESLKETIFEFVQDVDLEEIEQFREMLVE